MKTQRYLFSAAALISLISSAPLPVALAAGQTDRDAELLRVGNFPDKKLNVTEADLDDIVASFSADVVPIKLEHVSTCLDPFGLVKKIWRDGKRLMATIGFDPDAAPLLANRPVKRLSVGLDRDTTTKKLSLAEVSLVLKPRLSTAALLNDGDQADRLAALEAKLTAQDVDAKILSLKRSGKLVRAMEPMARALLAADDGAQITMSDGSALGVADAALRLLQSLPRLISFAETAATKPPGDNGGDQEDLYGDSETMEPLTADQMDYCTRVLKVDPAKVQKAMHEQKMKAKGN